MSCNDHLKPFEKASYYTSILQYTTRYICLSVRLNNGNINSIAWKSFYFIFDYILHNPLDEYLCSCYVISYYRTRIENTALNSRINIYIDVILMKDITVEFKRS